MNKRATFISYIEKERNNKKLVFPVCEFKHEGKIKRFVSDIDVDPNQFKEFDRVIIEFTDDPNHYVISGFYEFKILPYFIITISLVLFWLICMYNLFTIF